jgi:hypothetical protein
MTTANAAVAPEHITAQAKAPALDHFIFRTPESIYSVAICLTETKLANRHSPSGMLADVKIA